MPILDQDGKPVEPEAPSIRVCVAIPSGDHVAAGFAYDLAQMVGATIGARRDIDIRIAHIQGTVIHKSRRDLVRLAMKGGCTHMLFLDSDMRFPRNTIVRLLSHGMPIVAANYVQRRAGGRPITFKTNQNDHERVYTELDSTGLEEIDSTGMGVMLVDMGVFHQLPEPWFSFEWRTPNWMIGEDVYFCRKAREELKIPIVIDHDLSREVKHIGTYEYTMTDALVARDVAAEQAAQAGPEVAPVVS